MRRRYTVRNVLRSAKLWHEGGRQDRYLWPELPSANVNPGSHPVARVAWWVGRNIPTPFAPEKKFGNSTTSSR